MKDSEPQNELVTKLYNAGIHKWEGFRNAIDILHTLPRRSKCHHDAVFDVIDSCPNFKTNGVSWNSTGRSLHEGIEHAQVVYSIKLTVCELNSIDVPVPPACDAFQPHEKREQGTTLTSYLSGRLRSKFIPANNVDTAEQISSEEVQSCKRALYNGVADGPSWTSYTIFWQNVRQLCEASRDSMAMGKCSSLVLPSR